MSSSKLDRFNAFVASQQLVVLDGGFTTELETDGHKFKHTPLWSSQVLLNEPQACVPVHKRFVHAGARIIESNTYQCTAGQLRQLGVQEPRLRQVVDDAFAMVRRAIDEWRSESGSDDQVLVAAAIGPYSSQVKHELWFGGQTSYSEYKGGYIDVVEPKAVEQYFFDQMQLFESQSDVLAIETIPSYGEAEAALRALSRVPGAVAWLCFTCQSVELTGHGESFADCVRLAMAHKQVAAVGVNCSDPLHVSALLSSAQDWHKQYNKPFVVYANSGETFNHDTGRWQGSESGVAYADLVSDWVRLGARLIGGCCRVYSQDIAAIALKVAALKQADAKDKSS